MHEGLSVTHSHNNYSNHACSWKGGRVPIKSMPADSQVTINFYHLSPTNSQIHSIKYSTYREPAQNTERDSTPPATLTP